jgi:hypothetical protein
MLQRMLGLMLQEMLKGHDLPMQRPKPNVTTHGQYLGADTRSLPSSIIIVETGFLGWGARFEVAVNAHLIKCGI